MDQDIEKLKQAGQIAKQVKDFARDIVKNQVPLIEIAEKIESKITELGGSPAFPCTLSINEVAAHSTPAANSEEKAHGLMKVDFGVHIDGFVADTAITIDLDNNEENKKLIEAAEKALEAAQEKIQVNIELKEIGKTIQNEIESLGFLPIHNLSGHSIEQYDLHAGITIPNIDNSRNIELDEGVYAIEPFTTNGDGAVKDGKPSNIYHLENELNVRDPVAREVLKYIKSEYSTLPFCSRWIQKKFGSRGLIALKRLEDAKILHHHKQLIERAGGKVAQAENTIILTEKGKIISTA